MPRKALSVVQPDDRPEVPVRSLTVAEAAKSGDRRALLVAMRDRIAVAVADSDCPPRDLAALTRRLQEVAKEIESIDARDEREAAQGDVEDGIFDASAI